MIIKNVSVEILMHALDYVNGDYDDNITALVRNVGVFKYRITLAVKDCNGPGSRHGFQLRKDGEYRRLAKACWHVHGTFMDNVMYWSPHATIWTRGKKYTGEWVDWPVGRGLWMSQLCDC